VSGKPTNTLSTGSVATGQQLYQTDCARCHGENGAGGIKVDTAVAADLRQPQLGPMYGNDPARLRRAIIEGLDQDGKPLDVAMPRWNGVLSESQVGDIIAYLQTLR